MNKLALFFGCTLVLLGADTFGPKWTSVSNCAGLGGRFRESECQRTLPGPPAPETAGPKDRQTKDAAKE